MTPNEVMERKLTRSIVLLEARQLYREVYAGVAVRRSERVTKPEHFDAPGVVAHPIAVMAFEGYLQLFSPSLEDT